MTWAELRSSLFPNLLEIQMSDAASISLTATPPRSERAGGFSLFSFRIRYGVGHPLFFLGN